MMTAGAVFRVGFHTFGGWGSGPISDEAAEVDEKPETGKDAKTTTWYLIAPPVACLAAAVGLTLLPGLGAHVLAAAHRLWDQSGYLHTVYTRTMLPLAALPHTDLSAASAGLRGTAASVLALLLAMTSVFRAQLKRYLRIGAFLEGPLVALRTLQSGQVGDYVLWMTVGTVVVGMAYVVLLR
jgi:multicomponent Na+:H+ antiporter subunit D